MAFPEPSVTVLDSLVRGRARLDLRSDAADSPMQLVASVGSRTGWTQLDACMTAIAPTTPVEARFAALDALMSVLHPAITANRVRAALPVAARVAAALPHPDALAEVHAAVHAAVALTPQEPQ